LGALCHNSRFQTGASVLVTGENLNITPEFAKAHQEQADFLLSVGAIIKKLDTSQVLESKFVDQALKK
jgi:hypothetical protein